MCIEQTSNVHLAVFSPLVPLHAHWWIMLIALSFIVWIGCFLTLPKMPWSHPIWLFISDGQAVPLRCIGVWEATTIYTGGGPVFEISIPPRYQSP